MVLALHNLRNFFVSKNKKKRLGRGNASGHGTYSTRGLKGQKARSGGRKGLKLKGLRQLLKNKQKIGGFRSLQPKKEIVNIRELEKRFSNGEVVNPAKLKELNLINTAKNGVKILGEGKLSKKLIIIADAFSESAKEAIIKAGGSVKLSRDKAKISPDKPR